MRLEKMVKLMEDHQDRAQAQRTRLENRIAQLELALQRNKEQRYVREQSLSSLKFQEDGEPDKLSQNYLSDSDQIYSQDSFKLQSFPHENQHDSGANRVEFLSHKTVPQTDHRHLHDYRDYIQRQTSSDEEQPYICERCRQETSVEKDKDEWSNKNDSTDNTNESLSNWLTNMSSVEITQDALNNQDLQNDNYFYDLPVTDRNRRYIYGVHNPYKELNMEDSSRESLNPYQREYHQYHYRVRSPLAYKTMPYSVAL